MTEQTKQSIAIINAQEIDFVKGLKKVAESKGYEINYCYVEVSKTGFERLYIKIEPKDFNTRHLSEPEIFRKSTCGKSFDNKPIFRVSTTSYGTLNEEEMQKFMDAMNNGFSMQCYLNNLDWSKCPRVKFDEN